MFSFNSDILKSLFFVMDFKDPATLYIESLIGVHNNVMWYLILIVTIVYWTLYKIIKDSNWTSFSKQVGFLRSIYLNTFFLNLNAAVVLVYVSLYTPIISLLINFYEEAQLRFFAQNPAGATENFDYSKDFEFILKFFFFTMDQSIFKTLLPPYWVIETDIVSLDHFKNILTLKYLDQLLFSSSSWGYFDFGRTSRYDSIFSSRYSPFLTVQQFKHSTLLEVIWATFPSTIILLILVPSILLIYSIDEDLDPEFTIKVVGHQWFWSYEFDGWLPISALDPRFPHIPSLVEFSLDDPALYSTFEFDSCMVITDSLNIGEKRLLEVDNPLIVPCSVGLRFLITSADVLHSWAIPELGIKVDAVPGRLSQFISMIRRPGIFYGQCSEICGVAHAFMPIVIHGYPYTSVLPVWTDFQETNA